MGNFIPAKGLKMMRIDIDVVLSCPKIGPDSGQLGLLCNLEYPDRCSRKISPDLMEGGFQFEDLVQLRGGWNEGDLFLIRF
jgi:hypothetical protein